ncbi:Sec-independent protein translocase subunit TatA/TatB [Candidatus Poriferisodalis sp.]|uniref:Sec-independent protein translocase subunit TatA/TatB n=1 Tax=Candidatus Poriferisodalis sp. TaxID=3101277 RepID=UPI003AF6BD05
MAIALGPPELLILLIIVLVLFGGAKLPKLARSLGQAQREFRDGVSDEEKAAGGSSSSSSSSDSKPKDS